MPILGRNFPTDHTKVPKKNSKDVDFCVVYFFKQVNCHLENFRMSLWPHRDQPWRHAAPQNFQT